MSLCFLICSFLQKGVSIIVTPIFTRMMSTSEYGNYNIFTSWESIIIVFVSLDLSAGVYNQGLIKYEEDQKKYSSSMIGLTTLIFSFWFIIYLIFRNFFNGLFSMSTTYMILMFIYMFTYTIFTFWASEQRTNYKYQKLVIITLIASICNPLLGIILMNFLEDKVLARILGTCIVWFLMYSWMFVSQLVNGKKFFSKKYWLHALKFNIPLLPHYLSQTILNSSDKIMIEKLVDASSAGIYGLAYSISLIMSLFNTSLMQAISPWIYRKIKNNKINDIENVSYITILLIAVLNILLIAFAPEAVAIFAPKEYYEAIYIIPPVAMSVYFMYLYDLFAKFEFYYEKTNFISFATGIVAILNIVLNFIFIKVFGYIAAGYTTLICYILYSLFHYIFMRKVCKSNCKNQYPFKTSVILNITILFLCLSFMFMFLYKFIFIKYVIIILLLGVCLIFKKIIINCLNNILNIKKKY